MENNPGNDGTPGRNVAPAPSHNTSAASSVEKADSEWKEISLGEICANTSRRFNQTKEKAIFINTGDVEHGKFLHSNISETAAMPGQAKKAICKGDILFSEIRPANKRFARVDFDADEYVVSTKFMVLTLTSDHIDPDYFFLILTSPKTLLDFQHIAESRSGTFPQITFDAIAYYQIPLPPLPEQKRIAHILGTLDDKIELNRRMNLTLESMAQALFKSWFIDFDPVIDNALLADNPIPAPLQPRAETRKKALKENNSQPQTHHSLFPSSFTETEELGWIPESWEVSTIEKQTTIVGGGTPSTKNPDFWENGVHHWVTPKDFSALENKILLDSSRKLTDTGLNKVSPGLLPVNSVLMSSRAPVGYLAINKIETAINQGFIGMICNKQLSAEYVIQWADSIMEDIKGAASGSTFAEISKRTFKPFNISIPNQDTLDLYKEFTESTYDKIQENSKSISKLTKLRDTLLTKLISGEHILPEAKKLNEEALS